MVQAQPRVCCFGDFVDCVGLQIWNSLAFLSIQENCAIFMALFWFLNYGYVRFKHSLGFLLGDSWLWFGLFSYGQIFCGLIAMLTVLFARWWILGALDYPRFWGWIAETWLAWISNLFVKGSMSYIYHVNNTNIWKSLFCSTYSVNLFGFLWFILVFEHLYLCFRHSLRCLDQCFQRINWGSRWALYQG